MEIVKYHNALQLEWDNFIASSNNGTFLFFRRFMEYHEHIFTDFSLIVYNEKNIVAILPANVKGKTLYAHQGLSYGGIVFRKNLKLHQVAKICYTILSYLKKEGIVKLQYKLIPDFYQIEPSQGESYILFLLQAKLTRRDTNFLVDRNAEFVLQNRRKRAVKKAKNNNVILKIDDEFSVFWNNVLTPNLKEKYNKTPVHSLPEIEMLKSTYPEHIIQCNAYINDEIVAGTTLFVTRTTVHAQYIASKKQGRVIGALDYLFYHIISTFKKDRRFFSFGIANENDGTFLNKGLAEWKEGFGTQIWKHDFYEIECEKYKSLEQIIHD